MKDTEDFFKILGLFDTSMPTSAASNIQPEEFQE